MCNRGLDKADKKRLKWLTENDCIVNLSGGFECLAALWYAKEKGFNPICLHLYNPNAKGKFAQAELSAAQKQADYFKVDL